MNGKKYPLHLKIKEDLLGFISRRSCKEGERLPPENELARMLNASRTTVRKALELLEAEGHIDRTQGVGTFIWFIAVLSTAVGMLNLFPIPVLDGGHLAFHAYEAVAGRPPSDKALRVLMGIGLTLMLTLMVFALTNDLFCP